MSVHSVNAASTASATPAGVRAAALIERLGQIDAVTCARLSAGALAALAVLGRHQRVRVVGHGKTR